MPKPRFFSTPAAQLSDTKSSDPKLDTKQSSTRVLVQKYSRMATNIDEACGYQITEYFIPSEKICFNSQGAFFSKEPRGLPTTEEYVPRTLVDSAIHSARAERKHEQAKRVFLEEFKKGKAQEPSYRDFLLLKFDNRQDAIAQGDKIAEAVAVLKF